ncbi:MAG: hypothetical protein U0599_04730 [Vicinamibacteria bacterium]
MAEEDPRRAASILEGAIAAAPERAYLAFAPLEEAYRASGEPSRFVALCERLVREDPRDWRARLALARHLRAEGAAREALGLLLRALESNPHVLLVHLEVWRTLRAIGSLSPDEQRYVATVEESALYVDPHICTACRYRADDMLWRCPHCHEWNSFVEERVGPAAGTREAGARPPRRGPRSGVGDTADGGEALFGRPPVLRGPAPRRGEAAARPASTGPSAAEQPPAHADAIHPAGAPPPHRGRAARARPRSRGAARRRRPPPAGRGRTGTRPPARASSRVRARVSEAAAEAR